MTLDEFMNRVDKEEALKEALEAEKPQGAEGFIAFAKKYGVELTDEELGKAAGGLVMGGMPDDDDAEGGEYYYHNECGGRLRTFLVVIKCEKCGEWRWALSNFSNGYSRVRIPFGYGQDVLKPKEGGYPPKQPQ